MKCPFHDDTHASSSVRYEAFCCHSCGMKGNAYTLVRRIYLAGSSAIACLQEVYGDGLGEVPRSATAKRRRFGVADGAGEVPHRGNDPKVQARVRRRPFTGT